MILEFSFNQIVKYQSKIREQSVSHPDEVIRT